MLHTATDRLRQAFSGPPSAPGPKELPLIRSTVNFQKDPVGFLLGTAERYGDIAKFRVLFDDWYMLNNPADVYDVLVRRASSFHKPRINKQLFKDFMGNGLVSSDGPVWKRHHKMVLPAFHRRRVNGYGECMVDLTAEMIDKWSEGERVDIGAELTSLTLLIIAKTMFGADLHSETTAVRDAMEVVNEVLVDYINLPIPVPIWWPSKTNRRKVKAIRDVENVLFEIIRDRRRTGEDKGDLLSMLVFATDEAGRPMDETELRDEGMTLFFAGHETASHSMTWMWNLLATHPEVVERAAAELDAVVGDAPLTIAMLAQLPYLEMIVKEGMRMYGAAWSFMREPVEDVQLRDVLVPKGSYILISPHILHRQPSIFADPLRFDPERFSKENEAKIPQGGYVPFSMGPRVCLGKSFAMTEMRLIIGTLLQRIQPRLWPGFVPEPQAQISLHPANGMWTEVNFRDQSARRVAESG